MFERGTNQRPVYCHFDLRFTISILFGHALKKRDGLDLGLSRFLILGWYLILPGCSLYKPQVVISTPCGEVSTRETTVFVPGLLDLQINAMFHDAGFGLYPPRVALALRTPGRALASSQRGWGFHTGQDRPGDHRFRPRFVGVADVWNDS